MKTATEIEINVSGARVTDGAFKLIEASKLSLNDEFMKYRPQTDAEEEFKELVTIAIMRRVKDFWCPIYAPSFDEENTKICYEAGKKPAVGKSCKWWKKAAIEFNPERNSRLGTKYEYVAYLAVLIKNLIASGWTVKRAWNAVCIDSKALGHYSNSKDAKSEFEFTGSREICGFYDYANTCKILADDRSSDFLSAGGHYKFVSNYFPLANMKFITTPSKDYHFSTGWIVTD